MYIPPEPTAPAEPTAPTEPPPASLAAQPEAAEPAESVSALATTDIPPALDTQPDTFELPQRLKLLTHSLEDIADDRAQGIVSMVFGETDEEEELPGAGNGISEHNGKLYDVFDHKREPGVIMERQRPPAMAMPFYTSIGYGEVGGFDFPLEVVIIGWDEEVAFLVLDELALELSSRKQAPTPNTLHFIQLPSMRVAILQVEAKMFAHLFPSANEWHKRHGGLPPIWQVVLSEAQGKAPGDDGYSPKFPWDEGCDQPLAQGQPLLCSQVPSPEPVVITSPLAPLPAPVPEDPPT